MEPTFDSRVIIDHERYGERQEFRTIEEAQAAIRECGPEFAGVTLRILGTDAIYDEREECVGRLEY